MYNKERVVACMLVSLIAIPSFIIFSGLFVDGFKTYRSGITEEKYVYIGANFYVRSRFSSGFKIFVLDESNSEKVLFYSFSSATKDLDVSKILKSGEMITVSYFNADQEEENLDGMPILGLKIGPKTLYETHLSVKSHLCSVAVFLFLALFSLVFELWFLKNSKNIFKNKRITTRTDRPATEDLWKESWFE